MNPEHQIDRVWRIHTADGEFFAVLQENGDEAPSFTFVQEQVGGDGKPMYFADDALAALQAAISEYLAIQGRKP